MNPKYLLLLLILICAEKNAGASDEKSLHLKFTTTHKNELRIYQFIGTDTVLHSTLKKGKKKYIVKFPESAMGFYRLSADRQSYDFIIGSEKKVKFEFDNSKNIWELKHQTSIENELMSEIKNFYTQGFRKNNAESGSPKKDSIYQLLFRKLSPYSNTYFYKTFNPVLHTKYLLDFTSADHAKKHFFDSLLLNHTSLANSTLIPNLLFSYINNFNPDPVELLLQARKLISNTSDSDLKSFLISYFITAAYLMDTPEYLEIMSDGIEFTENDLRFLPMPIPKNKVLQIKKYSVGQNWADTILYPSVSDRINFKNELIKSSINILIIFSSECMYCSEQINYINNLRKSSDKSIGYFAISIDETSISKEYSDKLGGWKLFCDKKGWNSPNLRDNPANRTPYTYIISDNGVILDRNPAPDKLENYFKSP